MKNWKLQILNALLTACCLSAAGARIEYHQPDNIPPVAAPAKRMDWDLTRAYAEASGERQRISLNQYWKFMPCESADRAIPGDQADWGYFLVPGYWRSSGNGSTMRAADGRAIRCFNGKKVDEFPAAWYTRTINPPVSMKDKEVRLYFELFYSNPEIYINGRKVPVPPAFTPRFHVPVGAYLKYGEPNTIHIRAEMIPGRKYIQRGGIRGNLWLEARPIRHFGEPTLLTSVREKKMTLEFRDSDLKQGCGTLFGVIRDAADGKTVHSFTQVFDERCRIDYMTPKLWSPDAPALYFMDLAVKDAAGRLLDAKTIRFGFREFRVSGGQYLLNEQPIPLHTDTSWPSFWTPEWNLEPAFVRKAFRTLKKMNINSLYGRFIMLPDSFFDVADQEGILILYALNNIGQDIHHTPISQYIDDFQKIVLENRTARTFINHPCNIGILLDIWYNYHKGTTNPAYIGMRAGIPSHPEPDADGNFRDVPGGDPNLALEQPATRKIAMDTLAATSRKYIPELVTFTGADGHTDQVYGTHIYHTWKAPLAELSALFSRYAITRDIPIFAGELNIPFAAAFSDIRSYPNKQPLFKENAARLMGNDAYTLKGVYTDYAYSHFENDFLAGSGNVEALDKSHYYFIADLYGIPLMEYINHTLFPWRYDGMNGIGFFEYVLTSRMVLAARSYPKLDFLTGDLSRPGSKVEYQQGTHHRPVFDVQGDALMLRPNLVTVPFLRGTAPLTVDFAGAGKDRYEIDHAYFDGEPIRKQLAVINQTAETLDCEARIQLLDSRRACVGSTLVRIRLKPFTNGSFPFEIAAPSVATRAEFVLKAAVKLPGADRPQLTCSANLEIFPPVNTVGNDRHQILLLGCSEKFAAAVRALGFRTTTVADPAQVPDQAVLIFGAHSLENPAGQAQFRALTARGVRILAMEQTAAASSELMPVRCRKAFRNASGHPVLYGLKDADFANWRGSAATVPGYGKPQPNAQWLDWGARNMVAAHAFRRPAHGNYIPLLVSGFDLFQTPLLEYRTADRVWIACQLEITPRLGVDPVATHLFNRLLVYLSTWRPAATGVAFLGGAAGRKLLDKMQLAYTALEPGAPNQWSAFPVLVVSDPDWRELRRHALAIADYVYSGGNVLYLHTGKDFSATWLPFVLDLEPCRPARQARLSGEPGAIWRHGWDWNDLYWHDERTLPVFANVPKIADAADPAVLVRHPYGSGNFVLVSVTPDRFGDTPAAGKTVRMLSSLMTALGMNLGKSGEIPYNNNQMLNLNLTNLHWKFARDPQDAGMDARWFEDKGNPAWLTGQTTAAGEYVHTGIAWKRFLEEDYRGVGWYRIDFELTEAEARLTDLQVVSYDVWSEDHIWLNGRLVGSYRKPGAHRGYPIRPNFLKPGKNTLTIRLKDTEGRGGLCGETLIRSHEANRRLWQSPWPKGSERDYAYPADMLRMY